MNPIRQHCVPLWESATNGQCWVAEVQFYWNLLRQPKCSLKHSSTCLQNEAPYSDPLVDGTPTPTSLDTAFMAKNMRRKAKASSSKHKRNHLTQCKAKRFE